MDKTTKTPRYYDNQLGHSWKYYFKKHGFTDRLCSVAYRIVSRNHKDPEGILSKIAFSYAEPHRFYHTLDHIGSIFQELNEDYFGNKLNKKAQKMGLATLYHDIVYMPVNDSNESDSVSMFWNDFYPYTDGNTGLLKDVGSIINTTSKDSLDNVEGELERIFWKIDNNILIQDLDIQTLIDYEKSICKEYQFVPYDLYKQNRIDFLKNRRSSMENVSEKNIQTLIEYINNRNLHIGIIPGSFFPVHVGHKNVFQRAKQLFDKVIVLVGNNSEKLGNYNSDENERATELSSKLPLFDIRLFEGMLHDYIQEKLLSTRHIDKVTVVKGLRDGDDFNDSKKKERFTKEMSRNKLHKIPEVDFAYLNTDPDYWHVSSTAIRGMEKLGSDESKNYKL